MDKSSQPFWWLRKIQGWVISLFCFSLHLHLHPVTLASSSISLDLILLATLSSLSSTHPLHRPSFLISWEPGKWIKAGSARVGRAGTSQCAGRSDVEIRLTAQAARVRGVQMAISFIVIEDCASSGTCLQLERMISLFPPAVTSFTCIQSILQMSVI